MTEIPWTPGLTLQVDSAMTRDYSLNVIDWLNGHTIAQATVTSVNCTAVETIKGTTAVGFRVSAVTAGARVTVNIVDEAGQTDNFSVNFSPSEH